MESIPLDPLARFHRALVEEIVRRRPLYLSEPFTVSEIYQNLVPYRTHRDRLGVEMNGDYEDILLRLLAGEGEFLVLESEHARREIEQELKAQNPNTGLYREYAAVDVRLNPLRMPRELPDPVPAFGVEPMHGTEAAEGLAGTPRPAPPLAASTDVQPATTRPDSASSPFALAKAMNAPRPAAPRPPSKVLPGDPVADLPLLEVGAASATGASAPRPEQAPPARPKAGAPSRCLWCSESLPHRETLNYCPFCGADLKKAPCPNCGEELEVGWRFCVACGSGVEDRG